MPNTTVTVLASGSGADFTRQGDYNEFVRQFELPALEVGDYVFVLCNAALTFTSGLKPGLDTPAPGPETGISVMRAHTYVGFSIPSYWGSQSPYNNPFYLHESFAGNSGRVYISGMLVKEAIPEGSKLWLSSLWVPHPNAGSFGFDADAWQHSILGYTILKVQGLAPIEYFASATASFGPPDYSWEVGDTGDIDYGQGNGWNAILPYVPSPGVLSGGGYPKNWPVGTFALGGFADLLTEENLSTLVPIDYATLAADSPAWLTWGTQHSTNRVDGFNPGTWPVYDGGSPPALLGYTQWVIDAQGSFRAFWGELPPPSAAPINAEGVYSDNRTRWGGLIALYPTLAALTGRHVRHARDRFTRRIMARVNDLAELEVVRFDDGQPEAETTPLLPDADSAIMALPLPHSDGRWSLLSVETIDGEPSVLWKLSRDKGVTWNTMQTIGTGYTYATGAIIGGLLFVAMYKADEQAYYLVAGDPSATPPLLDWTPTPVLIIEDAEAGGHLIPEPGRRGLFLYVDTDGDTVTKMCKDMRKDCLGEWA